MSRVYLVWVEKAKAKATLSPVEEIAGAELRTHASRMHRGSNYNSLVHPRPEHLWFDVFIGRFFEALHYFYYKKILCHRCIMARTFIYTWRGREITVYKNQSREI